MSAINPWRALTIQAGLQKQQQDTDFLQIGAGQRFAGVTTTTRNAYSGMVDGDLVYNTTTHQHEYWSGSLSAWDFVVQGGTTQTIGGAKTFSTVVNVLAGTTGGVDTSAAGSLVLGFTNATGVVINNGIQTTTLNGVIAGVYTAADTGGALTSVTEISTLARNSSSGAPGNGYGLGLDFYLGDSTKVLTEASSISTRWTVATHGGTLASALDFKTLVANTLGTAMTLGAGVMIGNTTDGGIYNVNIGPQSGTATVSYSLMYSGAPYNFMKVAAGAATFGDNNFTTDLVGFNGDIYISGTINYTTHNASDHLFCVSNSSIPIVRFLGTKAGMVCGFGDATTTPLAFYIRGANITGTNASGQTLTFQPPLGTGGGTFGKLSFLGSITGSGSAQHTTQAQLTIFGGSYFGSTPSDPGANNVQIQGNLYVGGTSSGTASAMKSWSGSMLGSLAGASSVYCSDDLSALIALNATSSTSAINYPASYAYTLKNLRIYVTKNTITSTVTFTIYQNNSPTAVTCTIAPTTTGATFDLTHTLSFSPGDQLDLNVSCTGGGSANVIQFAACALQAA